MKRANLTDFWERYGTIITVTGILLLAAFFRFWRLNHLPPGLHPDEAANGLDIFRILEKHDFRPLYNTNGPREALFFYIQAIFVATMGNTILALRMAPAFIGVAGVGTTYLWAKSWFGQRIGLLSAFALAVSPWAVTISRDGFRASMMPLMVSLTLWLYTVALRRGDRWRFYLAGFVMGLGFYTYLSFRLFPAALVVIVAALAVWRRPFLKKWAKPLALSLVATAIALIPLTVYGVHHPGDILARANGVSFLNPALNHGHPIQTLGSTIAKTALMFNVHGDDNYRQNLGGQPELNIFIGIMFILGLIIALVNLTKPRYLALLAVFGAMLIPEILTAEGIPHALRSIGAVGPTMILAALGINYMLERWYATFPINSAARLAGLSAIILLLALSAYQGYEQYFVAWANSPQTYAAYSEDAATMGKFLVSHPFVGERYVVIDGYSDKTVDYLAHNHAPYTRIDPSAIATLPLDGQPKEFVVSNSNTDQSVKDFKSRFPGGVLTPHYSSFSGSELFLVYEVTK